MEPSQVTAADGTYRFDNLTARSYFVGQISGSDSAQTSPIGSQPTIGKLDLDLSSIGHGPVSGKFYDSGL